MTVSLTLISGLLLVIRKRLSGTMGFTAVIRIKGDKQIIPQETQAFDRRPVATTQVTPHEGELWWPGSPSGVRCDSTIHQIERLLP